jgi:hypothetical protein
VPLIHFHTRGYPQGESGAEGLRSYTEACEVLLAAAKKVAALYRRTDALAEAQSQDVLAALGASGREMNDSHKAAADTDRPTRD